MISITGLKFGGTMYGTTKKIPIQYAVMGQFCIPHGSLKSFIIGVMDV